jgi:hypothetical protein
MPGELYRQRFQIGGPEAAYGTDHAATRIMYFRPDSRLARERDARAKRFATGTRDNVRAFTLGPEMASGSVSMDVSPSEMLEMLLITVQGAVTPTTPGGGTLSRLWTFTPGDLDSATLEWHDGAAAWQMVGTYGDRLRIAGSVGGENVATFDLFGKAITAAALTGALADRVPDFQEGYQTLLYIEAFTGTPGTTVIAGTLVNWDVTIANGLRRIYTADNVNAASAVSVGELEVTANLTFLASPAQAATEYANWDGATKRMVRLLFKGAAVIEGTLYPQVSIDLPGAWSAFDLGQAEENVRAYQLSLQYVYSPTSAFGVRVQLQNSRTAAW